MRDEIVSFFSRMRALAGVQIDLCDATGLVREITPAELESEASVPDLVLDACRSDAQGKIGRVRFELIASKDGKRIGRQAVTIDAGSGTTGFQAGAIGPEDATSQGILLEFMRHNRDMLRLMLSSVAGNAERQDRRLEVMEKQVLAVEDQRLKIFETMEALMSHKDERALALRKSDQEARTQAMMMQQLMPLMKQLGGRVVARIASGGDKGAKPEVTGTDVAQFVASLKPEQQMTILGCLDPLQQAALATMIENADVEEKTTEKVVTEVVNGTPAASGVPANSAGGIG